ncbi:RHS repeat protein, partial [Xenorhabdus sp. Reich]
LSGVPLSVTRRLLKGADNTGTVADWQGQDTSAWSALLDTVAHTTLTTADATGSVLTTTDTAGNLQRVAYDVAGLLKGSWLTVKNGQEQVIVRSLTYSAAGQKLSEEHGNGVVTTYSYEPETQRLVGIKTERPTTHKLGAKVLQDLRYQYDPVGNVLSVRNDAEETRFWRNQKVVPENTYVYDSLYQLVRATGREMANAGQQGSHLPSAAIPLPTDSSAYTHYTRIYTYDCAGNLTQIRHSAPATKNTYTTHITVSDRSNRGVFSPLAATPAEVEALFTAGGQQTQLLPGQQLMWTPRNELLNVSPVVREGAANDRESYRYDGNSQRLIKVSTQKTGGSVQTQRVQYLPRLELRTIKNDETEKERLQVITVGEAGRAQVRVLHWESGRPATIGNDQVRYSYDNLVGSSGLELDTDGNVISMEEYYPYGGTAILTARSTVEADYKTVRYSGKERDTTGLCYYGYRYYQPWVGRWLSADPAGTVDGLNLYRMVQDNPVTMYDKAGLNSERNHEGWQLVLPGQSMLLDSAYFGTLASNNRPKIFIVGDGHASPPFKYAKDIPDAMSSLEDKKLNLYVEFTSDGWKNNVKKYDENSTAGQDRELPAELMKKSFFSSNPKPKATVIPWEHEIANSAKSMFDTLMENAGDFSSMDEKQRDTLKALAKPFTEEIKKYASELADKFNSNVDEVIRSTSAAEEAGRDLINILSGQWRDEYVNKYLANKIAEHASRSPDETFLISVGDAHIDEGFNPVQQHLIDLQFSGAFAFSHKILINKNARLGHD